MINWNEELIKLQKELAEHKTVLDAVKDKIISERNSAIKARYNFALISYASMRYNQTADAIKWAKLNRSLEMSLKEEER